MEALNWDVTTNRYVGIIDIMGFKDFVGRNSHDKVYNLMKRVSDAVKSTEKYFSKGENTSGVEEKLVFITSYSDSIMIYSKDSSSASLQHFVHCTANLTDELFLAKIPHKGAVAFGEMTLDFENWIFFGQPLIDAFILQDDLLLYGIVAHASIEYRRGFKSSELVYEYLCPFKGGISNHFTILPATFVFSEDDDFEEEFIALTQAIRNLRRDTSGSLRKYIDNTLTYIESSKVKVSS